MSTPIHLVKKMDCASMIKENRISAQLKDIKSSCLISKVLIFIFVFIDLIVVHTLTSSFFLVQTLLIDFKASCHSFLVQSMQVDKFPIGLNLIQYIQPSHRVITYERVVLTVWWW